MGFKYILLYHSRPFKTIEEVENYDKSFKFEGNVVTIQEALKLKMCGKTIQYPRSYIRYHYSLIPRIKDTIILPGRPIRLPGRACPISQINHKSIQICIEGDYNTQNPSRDALNSLFILTRGLCLEYNIKPIKILPGRYFDKESDNPGLFFNTKRFVKEYFLNNGGI